MSSVEKVHLLLYGNETFNINKIERFLSKLSNLFVKLVVFHKTEMIYKGSPPPTPDTWQLQSPLSCVNNHMKVIKMFPLPFSSPFRWHAFLF